MKLLQIIGLRAPIMGGLSAKHPQRVLLVLVASGCLLHLPTGQAAPGSWSQKRDIPMLVSGLPAGCALNGLFYVIGGAESTNKTWDPLPIVYAYDPQTDSWERKRDMPTPRRFTAAVAVDNNIYVIGGAVGLWPSNIATNLVEAYDPATDTWTRKAGMLTARALHAVCAVDGIIYAIGGCQVWGQPFVTMEAYDPRTDRWTPKRSLNTGVVFQTSSVVNGRIYVFIGTSTFAYDPVTDIWSTKASHIPWSYGLMSAAVGGIIYIFGGMPQNMVGAYDFTLAYDPSQDRFSTRRRMPRTRVLAPCAPIDGKIYITAAVSKEPLVNPDATFYSVTDVFDPQGGVTPQIISGSYESFNSFHLVWQAEPGIRYGIESSANLVGWLATGPTVLASNNIAEATCSTGGYSNRYFRVFETK